MRILHIIPSAFTYFDATRDRAFAMIDEEEKIGLEVEAFTLQYGPASKRLQSAVRRQAPTRTFQGNATLKDVIASFTQFDLLHVHCPLLGGTYEILKFKQKNPGMPLVVTYHDAFVAPDLFGVFVSWYNAWYLPRLFKEADGIVALTSNKRLLNNSKVIDLTPKANELHYLPDVSVYKALYATLIYKNV